MHPDLQLCFVAVAFENTAIGKVNVRKRIYMVCLCSVVLIDIIRKTKE